MWIDKELISDYVALARTCNYMAIIHKRSGCAWLLSSYRANRDSYMAQAHYLKGGSHH